MFTGIVEEVGHVRALRREGEPSQGGGGRLEVACRTVLEGTAIGASVSVAGVCLTVTALSPDGDGFIADLMGETLERSALGGLRPGDPVNLERALLAGGRLDGHLVQGHVDAVGEVLAVEPHADWTLLRCSLPAGLGPYVVEKGSITVDGTSLTVTAVDDRSFSVGLVPHTLAATTFGSRRRGDRVNLEADVVAKYVQRLLRSGTATPYGAAPERFLSPESPQPGADA